MSSARLLVATVLLQLAAHSTAGRSGTSLAYDEFLLEHGHRQEAGDTVGYDARQEIFAASAAEVDAHNALGKSWTMVTNRFADFTPGELDKMLGYKRVGGRWAESSQGSSFAQMDNEELDNDNIDVASLAKAKDWRPMMNISNFVHNQGSCGSCWAHAAVGAMEAHAEITSGIAAQLATQEIIDLTANPRKCGGTGGCHGATAEMAFEYGRKYGIPRQDAYIKGQQAPALVKLKGFVRLPENSQSYLLRALATKGPVALSIDAANLFMYHGGVFSGCKPDTIVNHAVLGVGYGTDAASGKMYYLIKNSWGDSWGEKGYIRSERHALDSDYCGWDNKPEDGVYCEDHPKRIRVCGMCGITSDSAYPVMYPRTALRQPEQSASPTLAIAKLLSRL